jgi:hypothetical protein
MLLNPADRDSRFSRKIPKIQALRSYMRSSTWGELGRSPQGLNVSERDERLPEQAPHERWMEIVSPRRHGSSQGVID